MAAAAAVPVAVAIVVVVAVFIVVGFQKGRVRLTTHQYVVVFENKDFANTVSSVELIVFSALCRYFFIPHFYFTLLNMRLQQLQLLPPKI